MYSNNIRIILPTEYVFEYIPSNTIRITIPNTATTKYGWAQSTQLLEYSCFCQKSEYSSNDF